MLLHLLATTTVAVPYGTYADADHALGKRERHIQAETLKTPIAHALQTHTIHWLIPVEPQTLSVNIGDTVTFDWTEGQLPHNVYRSATESDFDSCATSGGEFVAPVAIGSSYSVTLNEPGTVYYICSVPGHCSGGQKIAITVS